MPPVIRAVIFDYGGVISSPLFHGIGEFEAAEGYRKGSLLSLLFGETHYIGVHGRTVADEIAAEIADEEVGGDPDSIESEGQADDVPAWHRLERGEIDMATYYAMIVERAPARLGRSIDFDAYGRFMRSSAPGVHWEVVHRIRDLRGTVKLPTGSTSAGVSTGKVDFAMDAILDARKTVELSRQRAVIGAFGAGVGFQDQDHGDGRTWVFR